MSTIFILRGVSGEYSGSEDWLVKAFFNKEEADAECLRLLAWCGERGAAGCDGRKLDDKVCFAEGFYDKTKEPYPPGDPNFKNWGSVNYWVELIELV